MALNGRGLLLDCRRHGWSRRGRRVSIDSLGRRFGRDRRGNDGRLGRRVRGSLTACCRLRLPHGCLRIGPRWRAGGRLGFRFRRRPVRPRCGVPVFPVRLRVVWRGLRRVRPDRPGHPLGPRLGHGRSGSSGRLAPLVGGHLGFRCWCRWVRPRGGVPVSPFRVRVVRRGLSRVGPPRPSRLLGPRLGHGRGGSSGRLGALVGGHLGFRCWRRWVRPRCGVPVSPVRLRVVR